MTDNQNLKLIRLSRSSWIAIILSFIVNIVISPLQRNLTEPLGRLVVGSIGALFIIYALIVGIYALAKGCSLENRSCLKHGIIGVSLSLFLIISGLITFQKTKELAIDTALLAHVAQLDSELPIMIDEVTRLDRSIFSNDKVWVQTYTMVGVNKTDVDIPYFYNGMKNGLENLSIPAQLAFLKGKDQKMNHIYYDYYGNYITNVIVVLN